MTDKQNMRNAENYQQKASQNLRREAAEAKNNMDNTAINNRFWQEMAEELAKAKNDYAQDKANRKDQ